MLASPPRRRIRFSLGGVLYVKAAAVHVGYALVAVRPGPDDTWVSGDRLAELETLPVAPDERGQGIGSRLLDAVDEELARLGIGDLFIAALVGNAAAIRLYERRGLRPVMTYLIARFAADDRPG